MKKLDTSELEAIKKLKQLGFEHILTDSLPDRTIQLWSKRAAFKRQAIRAAPCAGRKEK